MSKISWLLSEDMGILDLFLSELIYLDSVLLWSEGRKFYKYFEVYCFSLAFYGYLWKDVSQRGISVWVCFPRNITKSLNISQKSLNVTMVKACELHLIFLHSTLSIQSL